LFFNSLLEDFCTDDELHEAGKACFSVLPDVIKQGQEEGLFQNMPIEILGGTLWSGVHGLASIIEKQDEGSLALRQDSESVKTIGRWRNINAL